METVPRPANDAERVAALQHYRILDTCEDGIYTKIVQEIRQTFHTAVAGIALVDKNRQWSKAVVGLPQRSIPREQGFCSYTILSDDPLVIEDTRTDPKFAQLALVRSRPDVRFYAGAPLIDRHGYRIGAVCILDGTPRTFSPAHRASLVEFARRAMRHIELHRLRLGSGAGLADLLLQGADAAHARHDQTAAMHYIELAYALWDEREFSRNRADETRTLEAALH